MAKGPAEGQKSETKPSQPAQPSGRPEGKGSPKGAPGGLGGCLSHGCKRDSSRFSFCDEHYEHFKFGLIKKTGEPVSDYERKWEHYQAYVAKKGSHKVA